MRQPVLDPIGQTARWVAAARALESQRPDRLFHDPFAAALAGAEGITFLRTIGPTAAVVTAYLALRTRFLDDLLRETVAAGTRQLVILAAGLDSRAFRLPWPDDLTLYELDRPAVLAAKAAVMNDLAAT